MNTINDGVISSEIKFEQGHIVHKTTQPTEGLILERNAELRKNEGVIQDLGAQSGETWGRQVASIPFVVWEKALRAGFQMTHRDSSFANKELFRFLQTPEGQACLIRGKI